ncbi:MAG: hypothetical protein R2932_13515 [Caldilineaceae bacterium]
MGSNSLPAGAYGVGMLYLPADDTQRQACEERRNEIIVAEGQQFVGLA